LVACFYGVSPCVSIAMLLRGAEAFGGVFILFLRPAADLVWPCGSSGALRLRACRVCLIFCRCSLVVLVREETSDCVGGVAPRWRGKAPTAADGDGLCCKRPDGKMSPVSQSTEMDEGRTASPTPFIIPSIHCSHTPHAPHGSGGTTIRMSVSQSECAIGGNHFPRV
ncbi:retrotransposon hot spot (RHS) protein, partial [Trypanosoma cruzi]